MRRPSPHRRACGRDASPSRPAEAALPATGGRVKAREATALAAWPWCAQHGREVGGEAMVSLRRRCVKKRSGLDTLGAGRDRGRRGCCARYPARGARARTLAAAEARPSPSTRLAAARGQARQRGDRERSDRARASLRRVERASVYAAAGDARARVARNVHGNHADGSAATSTGWVSSATRYSNGFSPCSSAV